MESISPRGLSIPDSEERSAAVGTSQSPCFPGNASNQILPCAHTFILPSVHLGVNFVFTALQYEFGHAVVDGNRAVRGVGKGSLPGYNTIFVLSVLRANGVTILLLRNRMCYFFYGTGNHSEAAADPPEILCVLTDKFIDHKKSSPFVFVLLRQHIPVCSRGQTFIALESSNKGIAVDKAVFLSSILNAQGISLELFLGIVNPNFCNILSNRAILFLLKLLCKIRRIHPHHISKEHYR